MSDNSDGGYAPLKPLHWLPQIDPAVRAKMFPDKLREDYLHPDRLDNMAMHAIADSLLAKCLFYRVGVIIFHVVGKNFFQLSSGYNGPAKGDVDPREEGCARVVDGKLQEGKGMCRGSHGELNSIGNCPVDTSLYEDVRMMTTLFPCYSCAKQIVNREIKTVYYIWEYGRDEHVAEYLRRLGITVVQHKTPFLDAYIARNGFHAVGACCQHG